MMFGSQIGRAAAALKTHASAASKRCCIILANDKLSERLGIAGAQRGSGSSAAVSMGFLRLAARRARKLSSPANVIVCAQEIDRRTWEGPFWFTRPTNRFISEPGTPMSLPTTAAVLSIATKDPSCPIAILPSDFWVARECVLNEAIESVFAQINMMPESVATLGMIDSHQEGVEDYLVVGPHQAQKGALIQSRINRPEKSIARKVIREGGMVASGILLGRAQAFAARINKYWPHLAQELIPAMKTECVADAERKFSAFAYRQIPRLAMHSAQLCPPTFAARAFAVRGSGWCSRQFAGIQA